MAPAKAPRMRVKIPPEIYLNKQATQTDRLTQLPAEVGHMVRDHLPRDGDKTCLALSCKANAEFLECVQKPARQQAHTRERKIEVMKRLRGFKGTGKSRLCFGCIKFMPVGGAWRGSLEYDKVAQVTQDEAMLGPRCPACVRHDLAYRRKVEVAVRELKRVEEKTTKKSQLRRAKILLQRVRSRCK